MAGGRGTEELSSRGVQFSATDSGVNWRGEKFAEINGGVWRAAAAIGAAAGAAIGAAAIGGGPTGSKPIVLVRCQR